MKPFAAWRDEYFSTYVRLHPEEATTLGIGDHSAHFRDISPAGIDALRSFFANALRDAEVYAENDLSIDERLDVEAIARIARFMVHEYGERASFRSNLEMSAFPFSMLAHQQAHVANADDRRALHARASRVGPFLKQHEANLEEGIRAFIAIDRSVAECMANEVLPGAIKTLRQMGDELTDAAAAYEAHLAFLREKVIPHAGDGAVLGEREVAFRLECFFGEPIAINDLIEEATERLHRAQHDLVIAANRLTKLKGEVVHSHLEAATVFMGLWKARTKTFDEAHSLYRASQEKAIAFIRAKGLFSLEGDFNLRFGEIPAGIAVGAPATNWPAPLLQREKSGGFLISSNPSAHCIAGAANLAVHEGIPGHYLQSFAWQRAFSRMPAPVRFVCVTDDVAMAHNYYGSMVNIEGFAAYAEELMLAEGFFSEEEALLSVVSKAVRAARVVCDLSLHAGRMKRDEAARFLSTAAAMPLEWAEAQVLRYQRIPLQALTYHVGCSHIWELKKKAKRLPGYTEATFHSALLNVGPVPPRCAADAIIAGM